MQDQYDKFDFPGTGDLFGSIFANLHFKCPYNGQKYLSTSCSYLRYMCIHYIWSQVPPPLPLSLLPRPAIQYPFSAVWKTWIHLVQQLIGWRAEWVRKRQRKRKKEGLRPRGRMNEDLCTRAGDRGTRVKTYQRQLDLDIVNPFGISEIT